MISFKGARFPKDVILYVVISTSGMMSLIVTLKPLWKKEVLKLIIPRSIAGLSTTHLPWLWRLKNKRAVATSWRMDETYINLKRNGTIYIEPLICRRHR